MWTKIIKILLLICYGVNEVPFSASTYALHTIHFGRVDTDYLFILYSCDKILQHNYVLNDI